MADSVALEGLPMTMGYFRLVLRGLGDTPEKRAGILAGTGVTEAELRDPKAEISLFQQLRQTENLLAVCGEGWALIKPELWHHSSHGAVGVAALHAPSLGVAAQVLDRYAHVRGPYQRAFFRAAGKSVTVGFRVAVPIEDRVWRPLLEASLVGVQSLFADIVGHGLDEAVFSFSSSPPSYATRIREVFGEKTRFNADFDGVTVPLAWLEQISPFADQVAFDRAVADLRTAVARIEQPNALRARVERLLHTMPEGRLDAGTVAAALGVSRRTLVRRLAEAKTGFRELLDGEIKARAARYLKDGALSHAAIAERLGYGDATSFSRACRRWFPVKRKAHASRAVR